MTYATREDWLTAAVQHLRPRFDGTERAVPEKLVALCSWPTHNIKKVAGQSFQVDWSEDGETHYVVISPSLAFEDVLHVLLHELVHATGISGHGKEFKKVATAVGLVGKMTATQPSDELRDELTKLASTLGPYPHQRMVPQVKRKEKKVRAVRLVSSVNPDYKVVMSISKYNEYGAPLCPMSGEPMMVESEVS